MSELKKKLENDVKSAMKAKEKSVVAATRLILAAIKQKEIDGRVTLTDDEITVVLQKLAKQRREATEQYRQAGRQAQLEQEQFELQLIERYLPRLLDQNEIEQQIDDVLASVPVKGPQAMGQVMGLLKRSLAGKADMAQVSQLVKQRLQSV